MTDISALRCACGSSEIFAVRPGHDGLFAEARDMFGEIDRRMPAIMIGRPTADEAWCIRCHPLTKEMPGAEQRV